MNEEAFKLDWSEEEAALWEAAASEGPSSGAEAKLMASLGLGVPSPGGGSPIVNGAGQPSAVASAPKSLGPWVLVAGVAILAAVPVWLSTRAEEPTSAHVARPISVERSSQVEAPVGASAQSETAVSLDALPSEKPASVAEGKVPKAQDAPSLADELAIIKRARTLTAAGDFGGAHGELASYRKIAKPHLGSEALMVEIELLLKEGKRAEASKLAAPLRVENSPYRGRVASLLGDQ